MTTATIEERQEQLELDLQPRTVAERTAAFIAYRDSRTPSDPYEPADAPIPF